MGTKKDKNKRGFSSIIVVLSIILIIAFTVASMFLALNGFMVSDTLTQCVFIFFGVELWNLAGIKKAKARYESRTYEENIDEEEVTEDGY